MGSKGVREIERGMGEKGSGRLNSLIIYSFANVLPILTISMFYTKDRKCFLSIENQISFKQQECRFIINSY